LLKETWQGKNRESRLRERQNAANFSREKIKRKCHEIRLFPLKNAREKTVVFS